MWFIIALTVISLTAIITDMISTNKKHDLKRIEKEIELEKVRLKAYEAETKKMKLELDNSKQLLLESKGKVK